MRGESDFASIIAFERRAMSSQTGFIHTVFFWLKEGLGSEEAEELKAGCENHLASIPGVLRLSAGFPAGTPRAVVDSSYAVGLLVEFADKPAHDSYQTHPDHLVFIEICHRLCSKVQVYDTLV